MARVWIPAVLTARLQRLRAVHVTAPSLLRVLLWAVIVGAASAFLWVLWTESIYRR